MKTVWVAVAIVCLCSFNDDEQHGAAEYVPHEALCSALKEAAQGHFVSGGRADAKRRRPGSGATCPVQRHWFAVESVPQCARCNAGWC